jgi:hypothetical protein
MMVVNGPIVKQIGLNSGMYCFGAGTRANTTISRAVSLLLANCAEAKMGGIQRGEWGYSGRFNCCVGENEDVGWGPTMAEMQGFDSSTSTVTIKEVVEGRTQIRCNFTTADGLLKTMAGFWPHVGGKDLLFLPPQYVDVFKKAGVSREDVRHYLRENICHSVAELKRRGAYHDLDSGELSGVMPEVKPGDENKLVYPFSGKGKDAQQLGGLGPQEAVSVRQPDIIPIVAGGDAGLMVYVVPGTDDWPFITREIRTR